MIAPQLVRVLKVGLTLIVLVVVWEVACLAFQVPSYLVPAPSAIAAKLYEKRDLYFGHTWVTLYETVAGFALAVVAGVFAAALIVVVRPVRDIIMPLLLIAQLIPKVAIATHSPDLVRLWSLAQDPHRLSSGVLSDCCERRIRARCRGARASRPRGLSRGDTLADILEVSYADRVTGLFSGMKIAITLAVIGAVIGEFRAT
jgi:NitT/TauT family transport system permease protein